MKPERYSGGLIRSVASAKPYQAERWQDGVRKRKNYATIEEARKWLEGEQITFSTRSAPLGGRETLDYNDACQILPFGVSLVEAAKFYAAHHQKAAVASQTVAAVFAAFMVDKGKAGLRGRTMGKLRSNVGRFSAEFGAVPINELGEVQIRGWLDARKVGGQTRDGLRRDLVNFWGFARRIGVTSFDPLAGITPAKWDSGTPTILTLAQTRDVLGAVRETRPKLLAALAVLLFAGLRTSELLALEWADIGKDAITIRPEVAKKRRRRLVPVSSNLRAWLKVSQKRGERVCPVEARAFTVGREAAAVAAGFAWPSNAARHSWISYRLALVKSTDAVALEAGNSESVIFEHYRQIVTERDAKAYFAILPKPAGR